MQEVAVPEVLYEEVIEVEERVVLRQDGCQLPRKNAKRIVTGGNHYRKMMHVKQFIQKLINYFLSQSTRRIDCIEIVESSIFFALSAGQHIR